MRTQSANLQFTTRRKFLRKINKCSETYHSNAERLSMWFYQHVHLNTAASVRHLLIFWNSNGGDRSDLSLKPRHWRHHGHINLRRGAIYNYLSILRLFKQMPNWHTGTYCTRHWQMIRKWHKDTINFVMPENIIDIKLNLISICLICFI